MALNTVIACVKVDMTWYTVLYHFYLFSQMSTLSLPSPSPLHSPFVPLEGPISLTGKGGRGLPQTKSSHK